MHAMVPSLCLLLGLASAQPSAHDHKPATAGKTDHGFLLPNGWMLTPAGRQIVLSDLPLNILPLSDNRHVLVATSGYNKHELSLVDLEQHKLVARESTPESWFGLVMNKDESRVWWSGGGRGRIFSYGLKGESLTAEAFEPSPSLRSTAPKGKDDEIAHSFRSGLLLDQ
jgi:hypothetical protein